eukprot:1788740-Rhodomonas_salina.2
MVGLTTTALASVSSVRPPAFLSLSLSLPLALALHVRAHTKKDTQRFETPACSDTGSDTAGRERRARSCAGRRAVAGQHLLRGADDGSGGEVRGQVPSASAARRRLGRLMGHWHVGAALGSAAARAWRPARVIREHARCCRAGAQPDRQIVTPLIADPA